MARREVPYDIMTNDQVKELLQEHFDRVANANEGNINGDLRMTFLSYDKEEGKCIINIDNNDPKYTNPGHKVLHGGMSGVVMDNAMGYVSSILSGGMTPTISMTINYIRPVIVGKELHVAVSVDKRGKGINYMSAVAYCPDEPNKPLLTGSAAYCIIDL